MQRGAGSQENGSETLSDSSCLGWSNVILFFAQGDLPAFRPARSSAQSLVRGGTDIPSGRWEGMWFDNWSELFRIAVITVTMYATLVVMLRVVGKRSLAKLNMFDFVITIAIGSTLASIIISKDVSYAEGALAFAMLAGLQWLVAWLSLNSAVFYGIMRSDARLLLKNGRFLEEDMRAERVTRDDILAAIRKKGGGRVEEIAAVVIETDGTLSVIEGDRAEDCSALDPLLRGEHDHE